MGSDSLPCYGEEIFGVVESSILPVNIEKIALFPTERLRKVHEQKY